MKNICLIRQDESTEEVNITIGEVVIGRGPLLGCTDKRVSRNHGLLKLSDEGEVILLSTHANPVFITKEDKTFTEINNGDFKILCDGDEFALLPDSYRFRVVIAPVVENWIAQSVKDNQTKDDDTSLVQSTDLEQVKEKQTIGIKTVNNSMNQSYTNTNRKRKLPLWMTNNNSKDSESNDVKNASSSKTTISLKKRKDALKQQNEVKKRLKVDNDASEGSNNSNSNNTNDNVKQDLSDKSNKLREKKEPDKTKFHDISDDDEDGDGEEVESSAEEISMHNEEEKKENTSKDKQNSLTLTNDSASNSNNTVANNGAVTGQNRQKCLYGAKCYRKNPQHRVDFCHPGDLDHDDKNLPECPFGKTCYRKNKQHRLDYKHTTRPRKAKQQQKSEQESTGDEDDYDYDDPFLNDASSDDYQPTDTGSEYSGILSSGEEETDAKRMVKEAKKFTGRK